MTWIIWTWTTLLVLAPLSSAEATRNPPLTDSTAFSAKVKADEESGILTPSEGLLFHFQYTFAPDELPADYQVAEFSPLKCGTDLVRRYRQMRDRLEPEIRQLIEGYLSTPLSRLSFTSTEGHFLLTYALTGDDAVPQTDTDPANGVPDLVERAAQFLEQAWTVEVLMAGFEDPLAEAEPYQVSFRSMQNYGYVAVENESLGRTRIVLHNNFQGFPPNDDPDGDVLGACKVTAAHEFKHASQFMGSRWTEGGWIEMDAVWAEELVFDQTNDYYNYLIGGSPIRHPEVPLDGGSTGTGSYEDCVFEIWLQETWGTVLLVDFWRHRMAHPAEPVLDSYGAVLEAYGQDLDQAWGQFTGWNYATNNRYLAGLGYGEAAHYPLGPVVATIDNFPEEHSGSVEHLAANFVRLQGFDEELTGHLEVEFFCQSGQAPLTLTVVLVKIDGTGLVEVISLPDGQQVEHVLEVPLEEIQSAGLVIGNPDREGAARYYELSVRRDLVVPVPNLALETLVAEMQATAGGTAQAMVMFGNQGQENSILNFQASVWAEDPIPVMEGAVALQKNISGSNLVADQSTYLAGADLQLNLTVNNASTDDEWLTDVELELPAGVFLTGATSFSGGSLGDLVWDQATGDGVTSVWHGEYGSQGYGVIRNGEWASAQVELSVASDFRGPLIIAGTIIGDQFGADPHVVNVALTLDQFSPQLEIISPVAGQLVAVGSQLTVAWNQDDTLEEVAVALSRDGGWTWQDLAVVPAAQESCSFLAEGPASMDCLVRVTGLAGQVSNVSGGSFTIYPATAWMGCGPAQGQVAEGQLAAIVLGCDASSLPAAEYSAWLVIQHDGQGLPGVVPVTVQVFPAATDAQGVPPVTGLDGNFPNPFNPATSIRFQLAEDANVTLEILDLRGHRVRRLLDQPVRSGSHQIWWDGRDDRGQALGSGIYLTRMRAGTFTATGKMTLTK